MLLIVKLTKYSTRGDWYALGVARRQPKQMRRVPLLVVECGKLIELLISIGLIKDSL